MLSACDVLASEVCFVSELSTSHMRDPLSYKILESWHLSGDIVKLE